MNDANGLELVLSRWYNGKRTDTEQTKNPMFETVEKPEQIQLVSGWDGAGKTTYAMTGPAPHYLIDTEGSHNFLSAKKANEKVKAVSVDSDLSQRPTKNWFSKGAGKWPIFEDAVNAVRQLPSGTVIVDSGSDLLSMAISEMNIEWSRGDDAFPPMLYGQVYGFLADALTMLREKHQVVMTAKAKSDFNTGDPVTDIWNKAAYLVEAKIWIERPDYVPSGYDERLRVGHVQKNELEGLSVLNPTWEKITSADRQAVKDEYEEFTLDCRIERGVESLDEEAPDKPDFASMDTSERLNAKLQYVNDLLRIHKQKSSTDDDE